jgi:RiboL-PSP-HEPN
MKNEDVFRYKQQLDDLFIKISILPEDSEIRSHWARYLCIRVSGFLEVSVRSIYSQYAKDKSAPFVANYIEKQLSNFQNPNMEKILNIVRSFNPLWAESLGRSVEGEIKDAIDSIVAVRHKVAHGDNVGITYVKIKKYYEITIKLVELLEKQCNEGSI